MTKRASRRPGRASSDEQMALTKKPIKSEFKATTAKTEAQSRYINAIKSFKCVIGTGPAGTGKTYIAASLAADAIHYGNIEKLIITRPAIEAEGEDLGFLPGQLNEKFKPYLTPILEILEEKIGKSYTEYLLKANVIEAVPLAYMRGRSFNNTWVLADEAQNMTIGQMKMLLTRFGSNCKMIIDGDNTQSDIKGLNGLQDAEARFKTYNDVKIIRFTTEDIVRSGFVSDIIKLYSK